MPPWAPEVVKPHADGTPRSPYGDPPAWTNPRWVANAIYYPIWFVVNIVRGITMVIFVLTMFVVYMAVTSTFNHLIKAPVLVVHTRVTLPAGRALGLVATEEEAAAAAAAAASKKEA